MTEITPNQYWISPGAVFIKLNAMSDADYIQANVASGAMIMAYCKGLTIDGTTYLGYDAGHNYQRWPLLLSPTLFGDKREKYMYAAIPKTAEVNAFAVIVFPNERIDVYGKNEAGVQVGDTNYLYIFLQGIISASEVDGVSQPRTWTTDYNSGTLASDEAISGGGLGQWYEYNTVNDTVTFIKDIARAVIYELSLQRLSFGNRSVTGFASYPDTSATNDSTLVTPRYVYDYVKDNFLSKTQEDTAQGLITFLEGIRSRGDVIIGEQGFANGLTGYGMKLGRDGAAEMRSLILNESLEVPELRYNRVDVYVGNQWRAPGAGIIESVEPDGNTGVITLKLEDGEIGTVEVDDICLGIYHDGVDTANNAIDNYDDSMGNFRYAGFVTCYFRITEILDEGERKSFRYSLRQYADGTFSKHPSRFMHFVGYGNFSKAARQTSKYSTLTYDRYLRGVSTWEFGAANIAAQFGDLSNLNVFGMNMSGYSAYLNNIYFNGTIKQLADLAIRMEIENTFTEMLDYGESTVLKFRLMRGWENVTGLAARWTVARDSGDATNDQAWHTKKKVTAFEGMPDIKTDDADRWVEFEIAFRDGDNDLSMEQLSTLFTFTAYDGDSSVLSNRIIGI